jgi:hypothetical protein
MDDVDAVVDLERVRDRLGPRTTSVLASLHGAGNPAGKAA